MNHALLIISVLVGAGEVVAAAEYSHFHPVLLVASVVSVLAQVVESAALLP
ncbi:MAG: hypothetical protein IPM20_03075 [Gammaproteobacteria bacterium]|nr:hypothetical protein [Gammaproteobacteria bacterium]